MNNPGYHTKKSRPAMGRVYLARIILFIAIFLILLGLAYAALMLSLRFGTAAASPMQLPTPDDAPDMALASVSISESDAPLSEIERAMKVDFVADLSEYEQYMNPEARDEYLTLINVSHPLSEDYAPDDLIDLVDTRKDGRATQQIRLYAAKSLEAMLIEARANGVNNVTVTSGYRPYSYQKTLFDARVKMYSSLGSEAAYKKAATIVAIPGTSEHQSGLCADIHNISTGADVSFGATAEGKWIAENCWKFGFIIRFPEDKVDITGISYEPWHVRFVGRYHAYKIYKDGLCLEEYHEQLEQN